jgi:hypothetical protein
MDCFHVLLGRPCKYDKNVIHNRRKNAYTLGKNGCKHMLFPIEDKGVNEESIPNILLMGGKEILNEVKKEQETLLLW